MDDGRVYVYSLGVRAKCTASISLPCVTRFFVKSGWSRRSFLPGVASTVCQTVLLFSSSSALRDHQRCAAFSSVIRHSRPLSGHMFRRFISYGGRGPGRGVDELAGEVQQASSCFQVTIWLFVGAPTVHLATREGDALFPPVAPKALLHAVSVNKLEPTWRAVFRTAEGFPLSPSFSFSFHSLLHPC